MKYQHYAARFAAKEAIFKAVSDRLSNKFELSWRDVEVVNDENGKPLVRFIGKTIEEMENAQISLSHCRNYAVATVVITWSEGTDKK